MLASVFMANSQCDISPALAKICRGNSISFSIAASSGSYSSIKWVFGDGDSSIQKTSNITHVYDSLGTFNVSVTLYDISGNIICGYNYSTVQVFDLPTTKFDLLTDSNQHFSNNLFKFAEKATSGSSNAPIMFRKWYFGDGDSSLLANPNHIYSGCGSYPIKLIVKDTNGCLDTLYKPDYIITNGPRPKFIFMDSTGWEPFTAFVKDKSSSVSKWEFIKGNGTKEIFKSRRLDSIFALEYINIGTYYLSLIGYDSAFNSGLGKWISCSAIYGDPADCNQPHFRILVKPIYHSAFKGDTLIQSGDTATFIDLSDPGFDSLVWFWGDGSHYEIRGRGNATHVYNLPIGIDVQMYVVAMAEITDCPDQTKYWNLRVVRSLGISQAKVKDLILVFPNPFTRQTIILLPQNAKQVLEVKMFDLNGKSIQVETNIYGRSINLYRNQLMPGIYVLEITADRDYMVKVIVE